jgi:molecular chaperone GrpE
MVLRQMLDILTKLGVETINPEGELFDANEMNAVMQGTEDEGEPGTVCQVLQKGYKIGSHVIRHAMVKVVAG